MRASMFQAKNRTSRFLRFLKSDRIWTLRIWKRFRRARRISSRYGVCAGRGASSSLTEYPPTLPLAWGVRRSCSLPLAASRRVTESSGFSSELRNSFSDCVCAKQMHNFQQWETTCNREARSARGRIMFRFDSGRGRPA